MKTVKRSWINAMEICISFRCDHRKPNSIAKFVYFLVTFCFQPISAQATEILQNLFFQQTWIKFAHDINSVEN